jgi:butyrate kinase
MANDGSERILIINPGSTSTKAAVFQGEELMMQAALPGQRTRPAEIWEEFSPRLESVRAWLWGNGISLDTLDAVVGRGGLLRPVEGGTYRVTETMIADARNNLQGVHASNLGCALAQAIADAGGIPAFVVDPVSTDEFQDLARYSGLRGMPRKSLVHALSIHALVREHCRREGRELRESSFVAAHLGGGISVCPVRNGRILDGNNANSGGPFSPNRAGGLPVQDLLDLAFSGEHTRAELGTLVLQKGGLVSYLGTDDAREVEARIARGDGEAARVYEAMAYQIAKEIGAMATVLKGRVDGVLLTGGLAASSLLTAWIRERVSFIAPVTVLSEMEEMRAMALGALRVLRGEECGKVY